jgi:TonB family protein
MTLHQLWAHLVPLEKKRLGWIVLLSLVGHLAAFVAFRPSPSYPRMAMGSQPKVTVMAAPAAGWQNGGFWFQILDPGMIALPGGEFFRAQTRETFRRSDLQAIEEEAPSPVGPVLSRVEPKTLSNDPGDLPVLAEQSIRPPLARPFPVIVETPPRPSGTEVVLSGPASHRGVLKRTVFAQPRSSLILRPTVLRFAVDPDGQVSSVLVDESSGDSALDVQAVQTLRGWWFEPVEGAGGRREWSRAVVFWDLQSPPAAGSTP